MRRRNLGREVGLTVRMTAALAVIGAVSPGIVSARPGRRLELLMDHPPLDKRLRKLEEMARELGRPVR